MESFDFIISIIVIQGLLQYLTPLSNSLQNPTCDLLSAASNANVLVTLLQNKMENAMFGKMRDQSCELAGGILVIESVSSIHRLPRI